jgi:hypothetical protein
LAGIDAPTQPASEGAKRRAIHHRRIEKLQGESIWAAAAEG